MKHLIQDKATRLFMILGGFFITNALVAEFIGAKIFSLEQTFGFDPVNLKIMGIENLGFNLTAGAILWPIVFVMTDIINEYYGKKGVKFLSYLTVGLILFAFAMVYLAIETHPNDWWDSVSGTLSEDQSTHLASMNIAFGKIFGYGLWIIFGSVIAFLVGQFIDVLVFQRIKRITGEKKIWLRATGSTLISQFIDSFVVLIIAFYIGNDWDLIRVLAIGVVNYFYKFFMAIILTPLIYLGHYAIDNYLGKEKAAQLKEQALSH
jgi:uncharacterized integral membrane protein (TIGR00697 family)